MRVRIESGLLLLSLLVTALITVVVFFPSSILRLILGLPLVLLFPGYVLHLAFFPEKEAMGAFERVVLSFGLSIVIVPLIGIVLNYTWWGITLESMLCSITSFILAMSVIAWVRRRRLGRQERFDLGFQLKIPGWSGSTWDKTLSVALAVSMLGVLGVSGYLIATPKEGEKFTEFYVLGSGGKAADYPWELQTGEVGKVIVGIVNQEDRDMSYHVEIKLAGVPIAELGPVMLEHEEKWEKAVDITPLRVGENQKVEFLLFKEGQEKTTSLLHLWLNVKGER